MNHLREGSTLSDETQNYHAIPPQPTHVNMGGMIFTPRPKTTQELVAEHPDLPVFIDPEYGMLDIYRLFNNRLHYPVLAMLVDRLVSEINHNTAISMGLDLDETPPHGSVSLGLDRLPFLKARHLIYSINERVAFAVYAQWREPYVFTLRISVYAY